MKNALTWLALASAITGCSSGQAEPDDYGAEIGAMAREKQDEKIEEVETQVAQEGLRRSTTDARLKKLEERVETLEQARVTDRLVTSR